MKGTRITVSVALQDKVLELPRLSYTGIETTRQPAPDSIHRINLNVDIGKMIRNYPICIDFEATLKEDKTMLYEICWA